jgi:hypothetical protein
MHTKDLTIPKLGVFSYSSIYKRVKVSKNVKFIYFLLIYLHITALCIMGGGSWAANSDRRLVLGVGGLGKLDRGLGRGEPFFPDSGSDSDKTFQISWKLGRVHIEFFTDLFNCTHPAHAPHQHLLNCTHTAHATHQHLLNCTHPAHATLQHLLNCTHPAHTTHQHLLNCSALLTRRGTLETLCTAYLLSKNLTDAKAQCLIKIIMPESISKILIPIRNKNSQKRNYDRSAYSCMLQENRWVDRGIHIL